MKTKIEIKSIWGSILFSFEKENNIIKDTVEEAIKSSADLCFADLRSADLRFANLRSADLRFANLSSADLCFADLRSADLRFADLCFADLRSADLRFANLRSADLRSAKNIIYSSCYFSGHGECGRQLLAVKINEQIILFCGCFKGSEEELIKYIERGEEKYKYSRTLALKTVLKLICIDNERH